MKTLPVVKTKTWSKHTPPRLEAQGGEQKTLGRRNENKGMAKRNRESTGETMIFFQDQEGNSSQKLRAPKKDKCRAEIERACDTWGQEAGMTIFSHRTTFYFITICSRKTQYVPDRLLTFFPKMVKALGNVSKILSTHCIFEYYTSVILRLMNFNNAIMIQFANHCPQHQPIKTGNGRSCLRFVLGRCWICEWKLDTYKKNFFQGKWMPGWDVNVIWRIISKHGSVLFRSTARYIRQQSSERWRFNHSITDRRLQTK